MFVQNNFYYDAFFLNAIGERHMGRGYHVLIPYLVLNGACDNALCTDSNGSTYSVSVLPAFAGHGVDVTYAALRCELLGCLLQIHGS